MIDSIYELQGLSISSEKKNPDLLWKTFSKILTTFCKPQLLYYSKVKGYMDISSDLIAP
jgi:hypothetical protein